MSEAIVVIAEKRERCNRREREEMDNNKIQGCNITLTTTQVQEAIKPSKK